MRNRISALLIVLLLAAPTALAQQQQQLETVALTDSVYMLTGAGGNVAISIGEDGVFLIDDKVAAVTEQVRAAVADLTDREINFVFNTHWHGDHTGGNEALGEAGALIVAHDNVRERMSTEQFIAFFNNRTAPSPEAALPVVTFNDAVTLHLNGDEIHAFHVHHAHTDGDAVVHFRNADIIHMGDTYFSAGYPFIDLSSGGSVGGMIEAANRALDLIGDNTKVIPGHGPLSDRAGLTAYRDMLAATREAVAEHVDAGKSLDEITAAAPTAAYDAEWGQGFVKPEQFVRMVYDSLTAD